MMRLVRVSKIVLVAAMALTCGLAAYDNLVNPGDNLAFTQHVLSMDTLEGGAGIRDRAITDPGLQRAAFGLIVAGELLTSLLLWLGVVLMLARLTAPAAQFARAKGFAVAGLCAGFLVWQAGFMGIGGEWFAMWMSKTWNGQDPAFRFAVTLLGVLIYVGLPEPVAEG
jgi:predicted small integral membrane protein